MIAPSAGVQILVASHPVDFRKSADRLAAINQLREDCSVVNSRRRSRHARPGYLASLVKRQRSRWAKTGCTGEHANFTKEITPVICPEAQQNPSHPVISESYQGLGMI